MKKLYVFLVTIFIGLIGFMIFNQVFLDNTDYSEAISSLENNILIVGTDATYPPMESVADDGGYVGFDMDLISEIGKRFGVKVEVKNIDWDDLFVVVKNGEVDLAISSISITLERAETMLFSNPYVNAGQVVVTAASNLEINTTSDLVGKNIAAHKDTTSEEEARKIVDEVMSYEDDYSDGVRGIKDGTIDAIILDFVAGVEMVKNDDELQLVGEPLTSEFYGIATSLSNIDLINGVNLVLSELKLDGTMSELEEKWFVN